MNQGNKSGIYKDNARGNYVIMTPVFYEHEAKPAWRKVFSGTLEECKQNITLYPESLRATAEENAANRKWKHREMQFLHETGKHAKAEQIRKQYHF